jgi:SAM-dependent methyltransferase
MRPTGDDLSEGFVLDVPGSLRRGVHANEQQWIDSARRLVELVQRCCGVSDLGGLSVLDVGCGTKMTKVLLEDDVRVARYAGVDVDRDIIEFLRAHVDDPRFSFHHIDVRNELYNPEGIALAERGDLPVGDARFDIIWLFSVFTHLDPTDFHSMLRLLRRYAEDDGRLIFSLYVNEVTGTGFGPVERRARGRADLPNPDGAFLDERGRLCDDGEAPDFVDLIPGKPLMEAMYSRRHALQLIDGTGWFVESLNPPEPEYIQHYFVCRPG